MNTVYIAHNGGNDGGCFTEAFTTEAQAVEHLIAEAFRLIVDEAFTTVIELTPYRFHARHIDDELEAWLCIHVVEVNP